jgi:hypothetical protein
MGSGDLSQDITVGAYPNQITYTYNTAYGTSYATQQIWPRQVSEPLHNWANTLKFIRIHLINNKHMLVILNQIITH